MTYCQRDAINDFVTPPPPGNASQTCTEYDPRAEGHIAEQRSGSYNDSQEYRIYWALEILSVSIRMDYYRTRWNKQFRYLKQYKTDSSHFIWGGSQRQANDWGYNVTEVQVLVLWMRVHRFQLKKNGLFPRTDFSPNDPPVGRHGKVKCEVRYIGGRT